MSGNATNQALAGGHGPLLQGPGVIGGRAGVKNFEKNLRCCGIAETGW